MISFIAGSLFTYSIFATVAFRLAQRRARRLMAEIETLEEGIAQRA